MKFRETFITSVTALLHNKIRSFLTMLGVIIGVFAVVTLVSLVTGVQNYVKDQFDSLGSNLLFVSPGKTGIAGDPGARYSTNKLTKKNIDTITSNAGEYIEQISPSILTAKTASYKGKKYYSSVEGVSVDQPAIVKHKLLSGRFFIQSDIDSNSRVALMGYNVNKELFGKQDSVGKTIQMDGKSFKVIGALAQRAADEDDKILIPYTTMESVFENKSLSYIYLRAKEGVNLDEATKQVEIALYKDLKRDDFSVMNLSDIQNSIQEILGVLSIGLAAVAGISLLVGGIGIMNIMLVSVTERVSEIGLRKALGATGPNIATQFMVESILLSVLGGIIGLVLSAFATEFAQRYFRAEIPWWSIIVAFGFSLVVGVSFGTYPAIKASKLDPIEALRFE
ncbi:FtsX-like permease family protein [candidate division WWE3 bacterium]|uniref:FtsX-like permease family protein n=1 Tax=candidate division WWE3 bacterium TaxID=2053526 RepID=A0A7X9DKJ5_UNCKA|nr:FtsX-like permease family protein [candidate division WWE3 bacterium]